MFAFRRILYRISPEIHTLEFIPVLLYLLMSHSFLCLCYHVNQGWPGLWAPWIGWGAWRLCLEVLCALTGGVLLPWLLEYS